MAKRGVAVEKRWHTYIVRCSDGTLYTGIARDVARRLQQHNCGKAGARYTRGRRPVRLVYVEGFSSRSQASKREYEIKRLPVIKKVALIVAHAGHRPVGAALCHHSIQILKSR